MYWRLVNPFVLTAVNRNIPSQTYPHFLPLVIMSDTLDIDFLSSTLSLTSLEQGSGQSTVSASSLPKSTEGDLASKKGIDWDRLPGFQLPHHTKRRRRGWVWKHGHEIEETETGKKFWLCKLCHAAEDQDAGTRHLYAANGGTSNPMAHLQKTHGIAASDVQKRPEIFEAICEDETISSSAKRNIVNHLIQSFQPEAFKTKLIRWIVHDNVAFDQVESPYFREMMLKANGSLEQAGCLPTHNTIREWIMKDWRGYKGVITEILRNSNGLVNFSFDLWSSRNSLSLCGIVAHFIGDTGNLLTFLLSLPELVGTHKGANIAECVGVILGEFGIQERVGYFVLDNARNNDTAMEALAEEFEFKVKERRLRCAGHIINLVARQILFGEDTDAFEIEASVAKDELSDLLLWRKKGPVGRLHNVVKYIQDSDQRRKRFERIQLVELATVEDDGKSREKTYQLIDDCNTRWNSSHDMIRRAIDLRNPIDAFLQTELSQWKNYWNNITANGTKPAPKRHRAQPKICQDILTAEDWSTLTEYLAILEPLKEASLRLEGRAGQGNLLHRF